MKSKKRVVMLVAISLALVFGIVFTICFLRLPAEPIYEGRPISFWISGSRLESREQQLQRAQIINKIGPEALPWLIRVSKRNDSMLLRWYKELWLKKPALQPYLPQPFSLKWISLRDNAHMLISRLAPGTRYEEVGAKAIVSTISNYKSYSLQFAFYNLGRFTNCGSIVVPVLLRGVTNPVVAQVAIAELQKFPGTATPYLCSMAASETGFIRPAKLALKKVNGERYLKFCEEQGLVP
jgi:hypothetical protein